MIVDVKELKQVLKGVILYDSSVGVKHVALPDNGDLSYVIDNISSSGLKLANEASLVTNLEMVERVEEFDWHQLLKNSSLEIGLSVVVAFPKVFYSLDQEEYFLGDFSDKVDTSLLPLDRYVNNIGYLPKEFVVGYIYNDGNQQSLVLNENYIGFSSIKEQMVVFQDLIKKMREKRIEVKRIEKEDLAGFRKRLLREKKAYEMLNVDTIYYNQLLDYLNLQYGFEKKLKNANLF